MNVGVESSSSWSFHCHGIGPSSQVAEEGVQRSSWETFVMLASHRKEEEKIAALAQLLDMLDGWKQSTSSVNSVEGKWKESEEPGA